MIKLTRIYTRTFTCDLCPATASASGSEVEGLGETEMREWSTTYVRRGVYVAASFGVPSLHLCPDCTARFNAFTRARAGDGVADAPGA